MAEDYQFDDLDQSMDSSPVSVATEEPTNRSNGNGNGYASELFSKQIKAKFRTFFVDLKESSNGKFVKISEKSHGRKSTIMMDAEDVPVFIEALQEVKDKL